MGSFTNSPLDLSLNNVDLFSCLKQSPFGITPFHISMGSGVRKILEVAEGAGLLTGECICHTASTRKQDGVWRQVAADFMRTLG